MTKSIVISGPPAVGKTTVAKGLAKEFNFQYLSGGDVLKEMAKEQGFNSDGDDWWDTPEGMKFLNQREQNSEFDKNLDKKLTPYKISILSNALHSVQAALNCTDRALLNCWSRLNAAVAGVVNATLLASVSWLFAASLPVDKSIAGRLGATTR